MEFNLSDGRNCQTPTSEGEKRLVATPVFGGSSGEGLPYAPEGWPQPGDKWRWKVGNRKTVSGNWVDRYLFPPIRIQKAMGSRQALKSKPAVVEYLQRELPGVNITDFFASFIWKIPAVDGTLRKDTERKDYSYLYSKRLEVSECSRSEATPGAGDCKVGNKMCSLRVQARSHSLAAKDCDICCSEAGFCRDCCCILCCKTIDWAYGGYSFIRCEAIVDENYICGHVAHMDCALRSYMAGTVGGSIGLDVEYYCRRCDNKIDLISHVKRLLNTCEALDSRDDIEKILNLGLCILRGSEQTRAKSLKNRIELIMAKLKSGVYLDEIWKVEDSISAVNAGEFFPLVNDITMLGVVDITRNKESGHSTNELELEPSHRNDRIDGRTQRPVYIISDHSNASMKLEDEIDEVLQELRKSQESEYRIAEQKLYAQKDFLLSLYQQLDVERSELANPTSSAIDGGCDSLLANVLNRVDQIKHEEVKLRHMMQIAKGFGRTTKGTLNEHFGLPLVD